MRSVLETRWLIGRPAERCNKRSNTTLGKANFDRKSPALLVHGREIPTREQAYQRSYTSQLHDLDIGNLSRNILEIIVQGAVKNP
ncbi:uncharacterized protein Pyn_06093 [Prunus yedoensis var. nudiflora]|uniref:Uncharacterized protein n=1 Tax=Prunus yedoensis var. nudiflora TaxID=2094558 RepID=A0A314UAE3_PRUYE|nr:uncharacterized protein Pyn_19489 [Prunus yedoensis var. nudiflora]PQQ00687.1 uncharacterized protein Pyn_06093 [Prunus yedoensis var. nudiflora]